MGSPNESRTNLSPRASAHRQDTRWRVYSSLLSLQPQYCLSQTDAGKFATLLFVDESSAESLAAMVLVLLLEKKLNLA